MSGEDDRMSAPFLLGVTLRLAIGFFFTSNPSSSFTLENWIGGQGAGSRGERAILCV